MSDYNQNEKEVQSVFIIKPKTMVLGRPVYHVKEIKGASDEKVLAVCPWLEDAERLVNALAQVEGGMVRVETEDEMEMTIGENDEVPRIVKQDGVTDEMEEAEVSDGDTESMQEDGGGLPESGQFLSGDLEEDLEGGIEPAENQEFELPSIPKDINGSEIS